MRRWLRSSSIRVATATSNSEPTVQRNGARVSATAMESSSTASLSSGRRFSVGDRSRGRHRGGAGRGYGRWSVGDEGAGSLGRTEAGRTVVARAGGAQVGDAAGAVGAGGHGVERGRVLVRVGGGGAARRPAAG